jgi:FkbM family methyltransferase
LHSLVNPGDHVWDIGAHKGYVSMALARRVGPSGSVVSFEPSAANLWFIRKHIEWNALGNVRILPVAVSDHDGEEPFGGQGSSVTFRLGRGSDRVRVATLQSLNVEEGLATPAVMKIDVEGSEGAVLSGAGDLLSERTLLFISVHGRSCYDECHAVLSERGFRLYESRALAERLADPSLHWGADHELLAVGVQHGASEELIRGLALFARHPG